MEHLGFSPDVTFLSQFYQKMSVTHDQNFQNIATICTAFCLKFTIILRHVRTADWWENRTYNITRVKLYGIGLSGLICKLHGQSSTSQIAQWWRPWPRSPGGSYFHFQCGVESNPSSSKKWPSCPLKVTSPHFVLGLSWKL